MGILHLWSKLNLPSSAQLSLFLHPQTGIFKQVPMLVSRNFDYRPQKRSPTFSSIGSFKISLKNHNWKHVCGRWNPSELLLGKFVLPEVLCTQITPLWHLGVNIFLKGLHNLLNSWPLFLAAYMAGELFLESSTSAVRPEVPWKCKSMFCMAFQWELLRVQPLHHSLLCQGLVSILGRMESFSFLRDMRPVVGLCTCIFCSLF